MADGAYKYFKDLPPWGKFVVIVAVGAAGWTIYRQVSKAIARGKDLAGNKQVVNESQKTLNNLNSSGIRPSYPDSQYSSLSSSIQTAFDGCDPGNDDMAAVMNAINIMKNDADMYKLITTFGVRKWDECGVGTGDVEKDLIGGIRHELSTNQIATINTVLGQKGITFRF